MSSITSTIDTGKIRKSTRVQWRAQLIGCTTRHKDTPRLKVPDNTKTGVTKARRYDPDLTTTNQEMAMHYGVGVVGGTHQFA